ncbi:MAG: hypothetical protein AAGD25_33825 [Cyanobacteria bacterium P01_F01_bin.150]
MHYAVADDTLRDRYWTIARQQNQAVIEVVNIGGSKFSLPLANGSISESHLLLVDRASQGHPAL